MPENRHTDSVRCEGLVAFAAISGPVNGYRCRSCSEKVSCGFEKLFGYAVPCGILFSTSTSKRKSYCCSSAECTIARTSGDTGDGSPAIRYTLPTALTACAIVSPDNPRCSKTDRYCSTTSLVQGSGVCPVSSHHETNRRHAPRSISHVLPRVVSKYRSTRRSKAGCTASPRLTVPVPLPRPLTTALGGAAGFG